MLKPSTNSRKYQRGYNKAYTLLVQKRHEQAASLAGWRPWRSKAFREGVKAAHEVFYEHQEMKFDRIKQRIKGYK